MVFLNLPDILVSLFKRLFKILFCRTIMHPFYVFFTWFVLISPLVVLCSKISICSLFKNNTCQTCTIHTIFSWNWLVLIFNGFWFFYPWFCLLLSCVPIYSKKLFFACFSGKTSIHKYNPSMQNRVYSYRRQIKEQVQGLQWCKLGGREYIFSLRSVREYDSSWDAILKHHHLCFDGTSLFWFWKYLLNVGELS